MERGALLLYWSSSDPCCSSLKRTVACGTDSHCSSLGRTAACERLTLEICGEFSPAGGMPQCSRGTTPLPWHWEKTPGDELTKTPSLSPCTVSGKEGGVRV